MKGWKTWVGGLIAIGVGIYLLVFTEEREAGLAFMSAGLMGIGLGHKIEKASR